MEKQNTITDYTNFSRIQIYSVLQILTMKREKCIWILLKKRIFQKNIKIVPIIKESDNDTESALAIVFKKGITDSNIEFKNIYFDILVYVPLSEWILNDINLRPFLIMTEIEKSLKNKKIESIGTIDYSGFELELVTDIMSCYRMSFSIDVFN